jgi:hypothetical protein
MSTIDDHLPTTIYQLPAISYQLSATSYQLPLAACGRKTPPFAAFAVLKSRALYFMLSLKPEHTFCPHAHPPQKEL